MMRFPAHAGHNVSILISMQSYEWLAYMQGQACGSARKSPHLRVVFFVETLL